MEQRFQITVRGCLDPGFGSAFGEVETRIVGDTSVLSGRLVDAAFLDGVLTHLRDLGIELLRVETAESVSRGGHGPGKEN